jgi:hypothetical protein
MYNNLKKYNQNGSVYRYVWQTVQKETLSIW